MKQSKQLCQTNTRNLHLRTAQFHHSHGQWQLLALGIDDYAPARLKTGHVKSLSILLDSVLRHLAAWIGQARTHNVRAAKDEGDGALVARYPCEFQAGILLHKLERREDRPISLLEENRLLAAAVQHEMRADLVLREGRLLWNEHIEDFLRQGGVRFAYGLLDVPLNTRLDLRGRRHIVIGVKFLEHVEEMEVRSAVQICLALGFRWGGGRQGG